MVQLVAGPTSVHAKVAEFESEPTTISDIGCGQVGSVRKSTPFVQILGLFAAHIALT